VCKNTQHASTHARSFLSVAVKGLRQVSLLLSNEAEQSEAFLEMSSHIKSKDAIKKNSFDVVNGFEKEWGFSLWEENGVICNSVSFRRIAFCISADTCYNFITAVSTVRLFNFNLIISIPLCTCDRFIEMYRTQFTTG
jgi:hypothetical protein